MAFLSIVIPTCNRPQYLEKVVKLIAENTSDTEIIVSDNSDDDSLRYKLSKYIESGLVNYTFISEKVSVVDNFERALEQVTGKYITYLGDDDGIGPCIEQIAIWMDGNNIDATFSYSKKFFANYYWPGVKSKYFDDKYSARLFISEFSGSVEFINLSIARKEIKNAPGTGLNNLPRVYHGIVSFSLIQKIKNKNGTLFGGISPDIYSAYQIATYANKVAKINYPFIIPGGSKESTAGQRAEKSDSGNLSETEHTARFGGNLIWDLRIPKYYSPYNVWAYSLVKAVERTDNDFSNFNFYRLYLISYIRYKQFRTLTHEALHYTYKKPSMSGLIKASLAEMIFMTDRICNKLQQKKQTVVTAKDIIDAYKQLSDYIKINHIEIQYPSNNE